MYTTCSYQRVAVLEAGSKSGTTNSLDLTLRSFCQPEYTSTRTSASTCTCSAGVRVTDDGSLCLDKSSLSKTLATSPCQSAAGGSRGEKIDACPEGRTCSGGERGDAGASKTTEACAWTVRIKDCDQRDSKDPQALGHIVPHILGSMGKRAARKIHTFYSRGLAASNLFSCPHMHAPCYHSSCCCCFST